MRTTRPLAAMLAVSFAAFAAPAAHAQRPEAAQADMHASVALAAAAAGQQQDLRNADTRDAAAHPGTTAATTEVSSPRPRTVVAGVEPATPADSTDEGGTANGLGAVAGLIVIGLVYLYTRRAHRATRSNAETSA